MKKCPKCKQEKELFMFYKDIRRKDGLAGLCKRCHNDICLIGKKKDLKKYRAYQREYHKTYKAPYQINNPNYKLAQYKLSEAIKKGLIKRLSCEKCGNPKSNGHHPFYRYFEPLKVVWLCEKHHKEIHAEEKAITTNQLKVQIENKNSQMQRVERSINFYLEYHNVPEMAKMRILGNLLMVFRRELIKSDDE